jgi:hypothetical protein
LEEGMGVGAGGEWEGGSGSVTVTLGRTGVSESMAANGELADLEAS